MLKDEYDKIMHKIIGSAMGVHKILGNGFQDVVYQRALSVKMNLFGSNSLQFKRLFNKKYKI